MLRIDRPGPLTTVQDLGRSTLRHLGFPTAGAADRSSLVLANRLVGNPPEAAALEILLGNFAATFLAPSTIALAGATMPAFLNGQAIPAWCTIAVQAGDRLEIGFRQSGARLYVAVRGGLEVETVAGSRATDLIGGIGGVAGRALRAGDEVPYPAAQGVKPLPSLWVPPGRRPAWLASREEHLVRVVLGPEDGWFTPESVAACFGCRYQITPDANRVGLRLQGEPLVCEEERQLLSEPIVSGTVQIPPSGQPILLLVDHQTIGGYPRLGVAIDADLDLLGQRVPGERLRLVPVSVAAARTAGAARARWLDAAVEVV